jgi:(4S)-4-hydroxy-5-phosphonooxypentane-2,3-dione isomerase
MAISGTAEAFGLVVEFTVRVEHSDNFRRAIELNSEASVSKEPGCLRFDVLQALGDPATFVLYELYKDEAAFLFHRQCAHTQEFLAVAKPWITNQTVKRLSLVKSNFPQ